MNYILMNSLLFFLFSTLGFVLTLIEVFLPVKADQIEESIRKINRRILYYWSWFHVLRSFIKSIGTPLDGKERPQYDKENTFMSIFLILMFCLVSLALGLPLIFLVYIAIIGAIFMLFEYFDPVFAFLSLFARDRELGAIGLIISLPSLIKDGWDLILKLLGT